MPGMTETKAGEGMLLILHDASPGHETHIEHWYNTEHHFERLAIPGFREALRCQCVDAGNRRFLCLYRTESAAVLTSPAYLARVNDPTPWTTSLMPFYENFSRTVCDIVHVDGQARGGWTAVLALSLDPRSTAPLNPSLFKTVSASLLQQPGALRCQWLRQADTGSPSADSAETKLRGRPDLQVDMAILVDTNFRHQADGALAGLEALLKESGIRHEALERGCYQQVFAA